MTTPMLALIESDWPARSKGAPSTAATRSQSGGHLVDPVDLADHHELVAAEAGHGVGGAHALSQPVGGLHQQLVAGAVAEAVVDDLEVVEVEEEHDDLGAAARSRRWRAWPNRSSSSIRLGSPVRASWLA